MELVLTLLVGLAVGALVGWWLGRSASAATVAASRTEAELLRVGAGIQVSYGPGLQFNEQLARGQTMVLPAALGNYRLEGTGVLLLSYVPEPGDEAWKVWETRNS